MKPIIFFRSSRGGARTSILRYRDSEANRESTVLYTGFMRIGLECVLVIDILKLLLYYM